MASTNKTTNYELSQFIETDRPAWLTDYNGDMRKLDTALKAVSDVASGASGGISSLTDRMTAAEGAITTNANDITALDARTDALEAGAQSQAGTIAGIQTEQITQNAGIEAATELGYNLARPYDSASTYAVGAYVLFQNTLYKCVTAVSTGEAFDPTKWLAIKATDEISSGGSTINVQDFPNFVTSFDAFSLYRVDIPANNQSQITTASPALNGSQSARLISVNNINFLFVKLSLSFNGTDYSPALKEKVNLSVTFHFNDALIPTVTGHNYSYSSDSDVYGDLLPGGRIVYNYHGNYLTNVLNANLLFMFP